MNEQHTLVHCIRGIVRNELSKFIESVDVGFRAFEFIRFKYLITEHSKHALQGDFLHFLVQQGNINIAARTNQVAANDIFAICIA